MAAEIELRDLSIVLYKNGMRETFPVMRASLSYRVGLPPAVQVTISAANLFNTPTPEERAFRELFEDSPDGTIGALILGLNVVYPDKPSNAPTKTICLFSGYVSGLGSSLVASTHTIQSSITFQLVTGLMGINALPGGLFRVFSVGGGDATGMLPKPYQVYLQGRQAAANILEKLKARFVENPADCILHLIDHLRDNSVNISGLSVAECFDTSNIKLKLKAKPVNGEVVHIFATKLAQGLVGAPASAVALSALQELFLTPIPQTIIKDWTKEDGEPVLSKMIVRPSVSGWNKIPKSRVFGVQLDARHLLGISDTTQFRLDQRVDFWFVVKGVSEKDNAQKFAAIYAPGYGENGEAEFLNTEEFRTQVAKTAVPNARALIGRMVVLPWWMERVLVSSTPPAQNKEKSKEEDSDSPKPVGGAQRPQQPENTDDATWEDACKRIAVLSFLENGCAVNGLSLKLPLGVTLNMLPWLGDTISVASYTPADTINRTEPPKNWEESVRTRYGLLDGISMTFELNYKELQVTCGATLSQVHDEDLHDELAADNPLYASGPEYCYNSEAVEVLEEAWE